MPAKIRWIGLIVLLLNCSFSNGQQSYYSKNYTTDHGLPHNHVRSLAQDSTGFIWIGTWDGLSRYDGYEFRNYYHNPADSTSLGYFICEKIFVDSQNNLWIWGVSKLSKYNRDTDNFSNFSFGVVGGVTLDREGKIWINSDIGLQNWDYESKIFQNYQVEYDDFLKSAKEIFPWRIFFDNNNTLIISASDISGKMHLYSAEIQKNSKIKAQYLGFLNISKIPKSYNYTWELNFVSLSDHNYFILGNLGTFKLDKITNEFLPCNVLPDLRSEPASVQNEFNRQNHFISGSSNPEHLFVETTLFDQQNILWQGILSKNSIQTGLTKVIKIQSKFKHYFTGLNPLNSLNAYSPVLKDRFGHIWAGPARMNRFYRCNQDNSVNQFKPVDNATWSAIHNQRPRSFLEDSTGIWIGYFEKLLIRYDFKTHSFYREFFKQTGIEDLTLPHNFVHLKKSGNDLIIIGFKQIYRYNSKAKEFKELIKFGQGDQTNMYSVFQDSDSTWWIGANRGEILHFDKDFIELSVFRITKDWFNVEDIVPGDNNDLWLSLLGGGLAHFDKTTGKTIKVYTTADGLSNNTCYGMLKDKKGNLWISTNKGISKFNPKTERFTTFGKTEGLEIEEFNSDNTFLATDGEMFFAGMGGVVSFYPDSIDIETGNQYTAPLVITDFRVSGASRHFNKAIYETDSVTLNKGENNFKVTFSCIDFVNADKIKYRYRLRGEEYGFTETDHRNRSVNYANLLPGNYQLEIEATNANGEWISKTSMFITIPPFYYQTWWFRVLIILLVVGTIGCFIYSHNRQLILKARQKQDELKLESLRGQMNPHFIFNSLNSINYFISQNDRLSANRYIADFARLIRSILGNLSQEYIPLAKELESLNDYLQLEHLRFSDKFDYVITVDEAISPEDFLVFPGMVQPFIENAIWHGVRGLESRKGFVKIRIFTEKPGSLSCVVEDNGIGRKQSEAHKSTLPGKTSRGIGIVLERLKIINHLRNTDFKVTIEDLYPNLEETGTRVTVDIPVKVPM